MSFVWNFESDLNSMESIWKFHGMVWNPSASPWNPSGKSMESIWKVHGIHHPFHGIHQPVHLESPWNPSASTLHSMDSIWNNPGRVKYCNRSSYWNCSYMNLYLISSPFWSNLIYKENTVTKNLCNRSSKWPSFLYTELCKWHLLRTAHKQYQQTNLSPLNHHHPQQQLPTTHNHPDWQPPPSTPIVRCHKPPLHIPTTTTTWQCHVTDEGRWLTGMTGHINRCAMSSRWWWHKSLSPSTFIQVSDSPLPFLFSHKRQRPSCQGPMTNRWTNDEGDKQVSKLTCPHHWPL